ncbi:MAG: triose-phosphate isomerase [Polyangiales bacterium]
MNKSRVPLIAGNWKMHHGGASGVDLAVAVAERASELVGVEVVVAPPFTALAAVAHEVEQVGAKRGRPPIGVAGQNLYPEAKGAFTGEISGPMLKEAGCRWVILGHSERRQILGEADDFVAKKTVAAIASGLHPIVCVGETLDERVAGKTLDVVLRQLRAAMDAIASARGAAVVAYEPVWAIGTSKVATPADAQEVHAAIRAELRSKEAGLADATRILYGGSVKGDNAGDLLAQTDIDGALVGGAALDADGFGLILRAAHALASPPGSA